ncbi:uncharacterized protein TRIADDRAFT_50693 [Trichoplax adhaerens]|uniref:Phosphatidate cytidylyltransferase n=1 Tax=Trichoplax adhaerens TaxID=10228 RepID=B3S4Q5_TRIAD|nr:hypothetical protein TRIADDRAFT_50693 [Trichoplax adhaerens]EDV22126.1 hypothetical protein TRIADDRAFT_50693 [Trichoplax adhaerens]|eukprot:XP_002115281.1 hypothetical protein TRIADDRAFT_50693 [Trichoplax adhaerens]
MCIQIRCFYEIIAVGHKKYREENLPFFRSLSWSFVATVNYFLYGESLSQYFQNFLQKDEILQPLASYHRFISFMMYLCCFVLFVLTLKKGYYMVQFALFGWTHIIILLLVAQSHLMIQNIFEGLIWFLLPVSLVICNDIMAYIFGFFFGRTPLIKLSPKKTWEGFIGALFSTLIFGFLFTNFLARYQYFVCPVKYNSTLNKVRLECDPSYAFRLKEYTIPVGIYYKTVIMYPLQVHTLAFSIFSSLIAPFGGFFASGFKRAFKVKDFSEAIPGHGGLMDRFDCQLLTSTFVHVYYFSFLRSEDPARLLGQIRRLNVDSQLYLFNEIKKLLEAAGKL